MLITLIWCTPQFQIDWTQIRFLSQHGFCLVMYTVIEYIVAHSVHINLILVLCDQYDKNKQL